MNIQLDRSKDRLFNKHDSGFGELTRLLTFDKQPLQAVYLMQLTAFGGDLIYEIIGGWIIWVRMIQRGIISKVIRCVCSGEWNPLSELSCCCFSVGNGVFPVVR